jgi:signal transduction histidine kinase
VALSAEVAEPRSTDQVERGRLAEQQAALRRVATLVARGASAADVFSAVAEEVAQVLQLPNAAVCRFDDDGAAMTVLAVWGQRPASFAPGSRWPLDGPSMAAAVLRTARPARDEADRIAGVPIIVDGLVWGVISTSCQNAALPDDLEDRLAEFTELVATAIANAESREQLTRLAEEQAALRRVATLVARAAPPAEVFQAVTVEVAQLVGAAAAALARYEADETVTVLGGWTSEGSYMYIGQRFAREGTVSGLIFETLRPGRIESFADARGSAAAAAREMGWRSSVGAPITVEGRLWGALAVISTSDQPLSAETEGRLTAFSELVATAIDNAESHEKLTRLADEQAALRRVATLVAEGSSPDVVFAAVGDEVARTLGVPIAVMRRYDADGMVTVMASHGAPYGPPGRRYPLDGRNLTTTVFETGRAARWDDYSQAHGALADAARASGMRWGVGVPIVVDGALWGVMNVGSGDPEQSVAQIETRLAEFTQLLATAIANAESRAELNASRARIVTTADAVRRRIERDLHDGAQQQLLSLALELRAAQAATPPELADHRAELAHVVEGVTGVLDELREIALGIHPAGLAEGGLGPAVKTLAHRSPIPVELDVQARGRLPERVEVASYYVIAEALTNAAKHSVASIVRIAVERHSRMLHITVHDDGVGGADLRRGSGLLGLRDRAEALGGTMSLDSPLGAGTSLRVKLPLVHAE